VSGAAYYADKLDTLRDLFGTQHVSLDGDRLRVDERSYPILQDVIILLDPSQYPTALRQTLRGLTNRGAGLGHEQAAHFAEDIQFTFGEEWKLFSEVLPEHAESFARYFDLVRVDDLQNARVCDLGCGIGRWSYFLKDRCRELVLIDFSEAIFVARRNLNAAPNALFFMGDLRCLPFRSQFADFLFCLGVLHHLPVNALEAVRDLKTYAPTLLVYLYYALDNRPLHFRVLLWSVTAIRSRIARVRSPAFRSVATSFLAYGVYLPLIRLGKMLRTVGMAQRVPLYETYQDSSLKQIRQDVYDRFFTSIEQRFSRTEIMTLRDTFRSVVVSEEIPYWHFLCAR
jgi:SAM-dependent methyltransferase